MAADPKASANKVEATLLSSFVRGGCSATAGACASRIPDARAGVATLLGNLPPDLTITATSATSVPRGTAITFSASATDPDGPAPTVSWFVDGMPTGAAGSTFSSPFFGSSFGLHSVSAVASDGRWAVPDSQAGIAISLSNTAPRVTITSPAAGTVFSNRLLSVCRLRACSDAITLSAQSSDPNNSPAQFLDTAVAWYLDGSLAPFATGHQAALGASSLATGTHTLTVRGTDELGLVGQSTISIVIVNELIVASGSTAPTFQVAA